jgi:hypothetical protein
MKLVSITFETAPRIPGIRPGDMVTIKCDQPEGAMRGWSVSIRGASVFFISPPGWKQGETHSQWDKRKNPVMHEVPRSGCYFQWDGVRDEIDAFMKSGKYDSAPFGTPFDQPAEEPPKSILGQLDPSQMGDE